MGFPFKKGRKDLIFQVHSKYPAEPSFFPWHGYGFYFDIEESASFQMSNRPRVWYVASFLVVCPHHPRGIINPMFLTAIEVVFPI